MINEKARAAKLLCILSNDFGELASAMYMVRGYVFQTVVMMPELLFSLQGNSIPYHSYPYRCIRDVTAAIEKEEPDIVFLFSGYLYAINNIFDIDAVEALVQYLRNRPCRVVTSDPFLGLMSNVTPSTFSDNHPLKQWLTQHFSRLGKVFENITHLYLVSLKEYARNRNVSFYNPHIITNHAAFNEHSGNLSKRIEADPTKKRWLFVLSMEDYAAQVNRHGKNKFDDLLSKRLIEATALNRQPVLVGPQIALDSIQNRNVSIEGLILIPFIQYDLFMSLLSDAEYVFYWNILSNSILFRVMNDLPVFFFDRGHMIHAIKPMFNKAMNLYYADAKMPYLNQAEALAYENLALIASRQAKDFSEAISKFLRLPDPEQMVCNIIAEKSE